MGDQHVRLTDKQLHAIGNHAFKEGQELVAISLLLSHIEVLNAEIVVLRARLYGDFSRADYASVSYPASSPPEE